MSDSPDSRHAAVLPPSPVSADIVAKFENRTTPEISRKLIFGLLALQRQYGGP